MTDLDSYLVAKSVTRKSNLKETLQALEHLLDWLNGIVYFSVFGGMDELHGHALVPVKSSTSQLSFYKSR